MSIANTTFLKNHKYLGIFLAHSISVRGWNNTHMCTQYVVFDFFALVLQWKKERLGSRDSFEIAKKVAVFHWHLLCTGLAACCAPLSFLSVSRGTWRKNRIWSFASSAVFVRNWHSSLPLFNWDVPSTAAKRVDFFLFFDNFLPSLSPLWMEVTPLETRPVRNAVT